VPCSIAENFARVVPTRNRSAVRHDRAGAEADVRARVFEGLPPEGPFGDDDLARDERDVRSASGDRERGIEQTADIVAPRIEKVRERPDRHVARAH
jgi:hypothetical protein